MNQQVVMRCERCGSPLGPGSVVCPACGALVWRAELQRLAEEAQRFEHAGNLPAAAVTWQRALPLLPPESQQYHYIYHRVGALASAMGYRVPPPAYAPAPAAIAPPTPKPPDTWPVAIAKTGGSMLISMVVYWLLWYTQFRMTTSGSVQQVALFALYFAVGFVVLILIHELGHSWAIRHYGLSASPPIFYPLVGAVINLRQAPPNAKVEAVVGIGGPLLGSVAALVCFGIYLALPGPISALTPNVKLLFLLLSAYGLFLNAFNMVPVPPLDGGRVAAAITPWLWVVGLAALAAWAGYDFYVNRRPAIIPILVLLFAWPRVLLTLKRGWKNTPYYAVGRRTSLTIGALFVGLTVVLGGLFYYANYVLLPDPLRIKF